MKTKRNKKEATVEFTYKGAKTPVGKFSTNFYYAGQFSESLMMKGKVILLDKWGFSEEGFPLITGHKIQAIISCTEKPTCWIVNRINVLRDLTEEQEKDRELSKSLQKLAKVLIKSLPNKEIVMLNQDMYDRWQYKFPGNTDIEPNYSHYENCTLPHYPGLSWLNKPVPEFRLTYKGTSKGYYNKSGKTVREFLKEELAALSELPKS